LAKFFQNFFLNSRLSNFIPPVSVCTDISQFVGLYLFSFSEHPTFIHHVLADKWFIPHSALLADFKGEIRLLPTNSRAYYITVNNIYNVLII
jgi:hypothetical protein